MWRGLNCPSWPPVPTCLQDGCWVREPAGQRNRWDLGQLAWVPMPTCEVGARFLSSRGLGNQRDSGQLAQVPVSTERWVPGS